MSRRVVIGAGILVLLALALSFVPAGAAPALAPVRAAIALAAMAIAPGVALLALIRPMRAEPTASRVDPVVLAALVLGLAPFVAAFAMTVFFFIGMPLQVGARTLAILTLAALGFAAFRPRATTPAPVAEEDVVGAPRPWLATAIGLALVVITLWPMFESKRVRASIHGFLHSSLMYSVIDHGVPPENPFFADHPVRYYWSWHAGTAASCALGDVTPITAFAATNVAALLAFLLLLGALARDLLPRAGVAPLGVLLGYLGLNPFGAVAYAISERKLGYDDVAKGEDPLAVLQYLKLPMDGGDTRVSATLTKFLNVSSFPAAFALTIGAWWLVPRIAAAPSVPSFLLGVVVMGGAIALSPITGLTAGASLGAAAVLLALLARKDPAERKRAVTVAAMLVVALVIGMPFALIGGGDSEGNVNAAPTAVKAVRLVENLGPMLLIALPALWLHWRRGSLGTRILAGSIPVLLALAWAVGFAVESEYKLVRIAAPLLGVFAAESLARLWQKRRALGIAAAALVVLGCIPTNAIAWWAYVRHAEARLPYHGDGMIEVLDEDVLPIGEMYRWIRDNTPDDAVIVADVFRNPHNFAGPQHGDEVPPLTHRPVFTDQIYYMNDYEPDVGPRTQLVKRMFAGEPLQQQDKVLLERLKRPVFVLIHKRKPAETTKIVEAIERSGLFKSVHKAGGAILYRMAR